MSRWFRHYAGLARDEKLVRVALRAKQPVERVVWIWAAILESAAEVNDAGKFDVEPAEVARFLGADEGDIRSIFDGLANAGRVVEGAVAKWGARQFQSDKSATRQAAYRERKKGRDGGDCNQQAPGDGAVTATSRHRDAPETETETDSVANATDAPASSPEVRLWSEGLPALMALGVKERQARPMIGRWRSDAGDDCERVLTVILRAREACPADPIPWINASLKERANGKTESLVAVAKRMASSGVSFGPRPGTVRDGTGGDIVRLLPQGGRE